MGKAAARKRTTKFKSDPVLDQLAAANAKSMLFANMFSMGWRLALMVLIPIFAGVQLDKKFDTSPSLTLAAFFIAVFGAGLLIARTFNEMTRQQLMEDEKAAKRKLRLRKRRKHV